MKKGFLVYFDNCRQLECLSDCAYAAVWRTVTEYARRLAEGEETVEDWLEQRLTALSAAAAMAARFMTDNVRRDDGSYQARIEQRRTRTEQYRAHGESQRTRTGSYCGEKGDADRTRTDLSASRLSREGKPFGAW